MHTAHNANLDATPLVLLVDDSKFVHRLLVTRLRSESITLHSEYDGKAGLEFAIANSPALIMLDLDMPIMDGFETLRNLKDNPITKDIPVIVLSGNSATQDKVTAFDLGAVDFICKPFELTELRARLRVSLQLHSVMQMLAQKAMIDGLTGLYNRAMFDQRWQEEYERCVRHGHPMSLVMIDIDNFKSINDGYGHPAGDAVISGLARMMITEVRKSDVACRYGGEEFSIILPETSPEDALAICERIRIQCEKTVWPNHPGRTVTISIGIAGTSVEATLDRDQWLGQADKNLYAAKNAGRNQTRVTDFATDSQGLSRAG
ncbi:MAG: diguanylate cyclase [Phycisphaerales bacterium]|nr:diguanylate cyclase [Phycisphaerales bacterium]